MMKGEDCHAVLMSGWGESASFISYQRWVSLALPLFFLMDLK